MWSSFVVNEAHVWKKFHEFWIDHAAHVPTHLIRFEDLLVHKEDAMQGLMDFLYAGKVPLGRKKTTQKSVESLDKARIKPSMQTSATSTSINTSEGCEGTVESSEETQVSGGNTSILPLLAENIINNDINQHSSSSNSVDRDRVGGGPGYQPRQGGMGKALKVLSPTQIADMDVILADLATKFGYQVSVTII